MINKYSISKALYDNTKQVSTANGFLLIANGKAYTPSPNDVYVQEMTIYGDDNSVGIADNSSDIQMGIYQININTPKALTGGKWQGLQMVDIYQAGFSKGLELTFNGQMLRIKSAKLSTMMQSDTHFIHILSIAYSVIN